MFNDVATLYLSWTTRQVESRGSRAVRTFMVNAFVYEQNIYVPGPQVRHYGTDTGTLSRISARLNVNTLHIAIQVGSDDPSE